MDNRQRFVCEQHDTESTKKKLQHSKGIRVIYDIYSPAPALPHALQSPLSFVRFRTAELKDQRIECNISMSWGVHHPWVPGHWYVW